MDTPLTVWLIQSVCLQGNNIYFLRINFTQMQRQTVERCIMSFSTVRLLNSGDAARNAGTPQTFGKDKIKRLKLFSYLLAGGR